MKEWDKIAVVIKNFDWDKVRSVMEYLNWTWYFGEEDETRVPAVSDLILCSQRLLHEAYTQVKSGNERSMEVSTGGLSGQALKGENGEIDLRLDFIPASSES